MARFIASPGTCGTWSVAEVDADGVGSGRLFVGHDHPCVREDSGKAARLLVLALSLPDGIDGAIKMLRAETVRINL